MHMRRLVLTGALVFLTVQWPSSVAGQGHVPSTRIQSGGSHGVAGRSLFPLRAGDPGSGLPGHRRLPPRAHRGVRTGPGRLPVGIVPFPTAPLQRRDCSPDCPEHARPETPGPGDTVETPPTRDPREADRERTCLRVSVHMTPRGTFRLRVDGSEIGAGTAGEARRILRASMRRDGVLSLDGMDGAGVHLPTSRVREVRVEPCRATVIRPGR